MGGSGCRKGEPMSPELAAQVIAEELGLPPERAFATWDPEPIAAVSIGQVHRAITQAPPATPMGVAQAAWNAERRSRYCARM
jgi:predicted unusual protein kinase regulating ubiquinone biosynthesis (AarF/ABC1/UbiB family)